VLGQHTLKPQEKTELKLVFKTTNAPGLFEKIATLVTDAPGQEQIELHMRGTVKEAPGAKIAVQPRRIDVGDLNGGEKKEVTITVMNNGNRPLVITAVTCREKRRSQSVHLPFPCRSRRGKGDHDLEHHDGTERCLFGAALRHLEREKCSG